MFGKAGRIAGVGLVVIVFLFFFLWLEPSKVSLIPSLKLVKEDHHNIKSMYVVDCITNERLYTASSAGKGVRFSASLVKSSQSEDGAKRQQSFQQVYKNGGWGRYEPNYRGIQGSGAGSSLHFTQRIRLLLAAAITNVKKLLNKDRITFLDVPCGDMVWMPQFLNGRDDVIYTGMDIVPELIKSHNKRFSNTTWNFVHGDIVTKPLHKSYDIIFCRHMLQHLRTADVAKVLENFSESGSKFLITTTWLDSQSTYDVVPGQSDRFRPLNLEVNPIALESPQCIYKDWPDNSPDKNRLFIGVWTLPLKHIKDCMEDLKPVNLKEYEKSWYTCSMPKGSN